MEGNSSRSSRVQRVDEGELLAENVVSSVAEEGPSLGDSIYKNEGRATVRETVVELVGRGERKRTSAPKSENDGRILDRRVVNELHQLSDRLNELLET